LGEILKLFVSAGLFLRLQNGDDHGIGLAIPRVRSPNGPGLKDAEGFTRNPSHIFMLGARHKFPDD